MKCYYCQIGDPLNCLGTTVGCDSAHAKKVNHSLATEIASGEAVAEVFGKDASEIVLNRLKLNKWGRKKIRRS